MPIVDERKLHDLRYWPVSMKDDTIETLEALWRVYRAVERGSASELRDAVEAINGFNRLTGGRV